MTVIITVPHAKPLKNIERNDIGIPLSDEYHLTDWLAEPAAIILHKMIPGSVLMLGDVNRKTIDLNRYESRKTKFRKKLRRKIRTSDNPIVIDVHSADSNFFGKGEIAIIQPDPRGIFDYQVSAHILGKAYKRRPAFLDSYVLNLEQDLQMGQVNTEIFCAWPYTVDLMKETRELGAACVLLEFNEETIHDMQDLKRCCAPIAKWANELNSQTYYK